MRYVQLVNRSSRTLKGVWDGRHYDLTPGAHSFPELMAEKFKDQNPIMGSEDPYTLQKLYLLGIVEQGDDVSPIEQSEAIELQDRQKLNDNKAYEVVRGNGLFRPGTDRSEPLSPGTGAVASSFVSPTK